MRWLGLCLALAACGDQAMPLLPSPDAADAPDAALQPSPDALVDAAVTPLIVIEETTFVMGCRADRARCGPDERPGQPVTLSRFAIDRAEVTQARYQAYLDATGAAAPKVGFEPAVTPEHPVVYVSWDEARAFCRWAGGDLPTAAQWELTLRGPPDGPLHDAAYPWGDEPPDCARANTEGCAGGTVAGGTLPLGRSAYGADNLVDNVREWVRDSYDAASHQMWESPEKRDPAGGARGPYRELRGASFAIWPIEGRAHERSLAPGDLRSIDVGFRCARELDPGGDTPAPPPARLGVSESSACSMRADRSVVCWGADIQGSTVPPAMAGFGQLAMSAVYHACALDESGAPICWGPAGDAAQAPAPVSGLVVGNGFTCGIDGDTHVRCWGPQLPAAFASESFGEGVVQLATGGWDVLCALDREGRVHCERRFGSAYSPGSAGWRQISVSARLGCGIRRDGTAGCWGFDLSTPVTPPAGSQLKQIDVGQSSAICALDADGVVSCTGPTAPSGTGFDEVRLGTDWGCARRADASVECFGPDLFAVVPRGLPFVSVASGVEEACALWEDGRADCWSIDDLTTPAPPDLHFTALTVGCGLVDDGSLACWGDRAPPPPGTDFVALDAGPAHACALDADGKVVCWGALADAPPGTDFVQISAGGWQSCARTASGAIVCWGGSDEAPDGTGWLDVSAGAGHSCALDAQGAALCWGADASPPPAELRFARIHAGDRQSCGVEAGGAVTCWSPGFSLAGSFSAFSLGGADLGYCGVRDGDVWCGLSSDPYLHYSSR